MTTRCLTLLRHAQAQSHARSGQDVDRALSEHGEEQAAGLAPLLTAADAAPDLVLCSIATRAQQTWEPIAQALDSAAQVLIVPEIYGADDDELLELIAAHGGDAQRVLVVGHEPVISALAHSLAGEGSAEAAVSRVSSGMSTAMLAFLRTEGSWSDLASGEAILTGLATP